MNRMNKPRSILRALAPLMVALPLNPAWGFDEDGYELWLRYRALEGTQRTRVLARPRVLAWLRRSFAGSYVLLAGRLAVTDR